MKSLVVTGIFLLFFTFKINSQTSFAVDDLIDLSSVSSGKINQYLNKKGFLPHGRTFEQDLPGASYVKRIKAKKKDTAFAKIQIIDQYKKGDDWFFALHTSSRDDFKSGLAYLKKNDFFYNVTDSVSVLFQKGVFVVETSSSVVDEISMYTFLLKKKKLPEPGNVLNAEDLLVFDSHQYLVSFFGEKNVKKDLYFFSENELKECSVIFGNSSRQALFVWDDKINMSKLSFILISDVMPTVEASGFNDIIYNNKWELKNGVHSGMRLSELIRLNKKDFQFYGARSKNQFLITGGVGGAIDFSKNKIVLGCLNCGDQDILNAQVVNALDASSENLSMYVYYMMLYPGK